MHSLTSCCTHEGAGQGFMPYQRLPRSHSSSPSHPHTADAHSPHHSQRFVSGDPRLDRTRCKNHPIGSDESGSVRSTHVDPYSQGELQAKGSCDADAAAAVTLPMSAKPNSRSQQSRLSTVSAPIDNHCTLIRTFDTSQIQKGRISFNEPAHEDINTVLVKIGIIGDSGTGKTSFLAKYGGVDLKNNGKDVALLQKLCKLQHVNIALHVWDFGGQCQYSNKMAMVCKDAAAIFIMFDLTRRSTLQSVKKWYLCARECSQVAMLVLIGTKYDGFVQMSKDLQLAIIHEARAHSTKMKASLFFSSVTYNINVQKVFKVVVAKLFDLPCSISQNFNFGEPIVAF